MKKNNRLLVAFLSGTVMSISAWAACTGDVDMGGYSLTNLADVNISDANVTGELAYGVNAGSVRDYIDHLIATGAIGGGGGETPPPAGYGTIEYNGLTWLDRNLGASQAATSVTDAAAYGDLYQWGRKADGHEDRLSATTATLATDSANAGSSFITNTASPYDWLATQDGSLWNDAGSGANEVCPTGYHVPTEAEFGTFTDYNDAFTKLQLTAAGYRNRSSGSLSNVGTSGYYWTSGVDGTRTRHLGIYYSSSAFYTDRRAYGFSVRCVGN